MTPSLITPIEAAAGAVEAPPSTLATGRRTQRVAIDLHWPVLARVHHPDAPLPADADLRVEIRLAATADDRLPQSWSGFWTGTLEVRSVPPREPAAVSAVSAALAAALAAPRPALLLACAVTGSVATFPGASTDWHAVAVRAENGLALELLVAIERACPRGRADAASTSYVRSDLMQRLGVAGGRYGIPAISVTLDPAGE